MSLLQLATGGAAPKLYVDDVFVAYTRTGTGASQVTTTNIDMTKGYTLWSKGRSGATDHAVYNSSRGVTYDIVTNTTAAQTTQAQGLTAVSATGHTYGTLAKVNTSSATYVDYVFREAIKFHHQEVVVKSAGSNATVDLSTLGTVGMVRVKRTDAAGSWYIWHRSLTAGKLLIGETTAAEATLGHITVSGNTVTLVNGVIADGTYLVEAWAHDTSADGLIQCGSFTGGTWPLDVTLGWEPQYVLIKSATSASTWWIFDTARELSESNAIILRAETSAANQALGAGYAGITSTGFRLRVSAGGLGLGASNIYLAIRRPNKPPTVGTQVYNAIARTPSSVTYTLTGNPFPIDLVIQQQRVVANTVEQANFFDRLRGTTKSLSSAQTQAEATNSGITDFSRQDGFVANYGTWPGMNWLAENIEVYHLFRRAPGVFDQVCYTGTGVARTVAHNLGAVPELMIVKSRSSDTANWIVGSVLFSALHYLTLNTTAAVATGTTYWNSTTPTASVFTVGTSSDVNAYTATYVAYLFASIAGISKVGSYTGNGTSQTINCGFAAGARFILIKRTDSAGDWYVWDTARGIVAANDPHLSLNTTTSEVTNDDSIDPHTSGFIVNQVEATSINVNGAVYIFLAIA